MSIAAGTLIGRYRVERLLGDGGMAVVVLAQHVDIGGRKVAIKLLHDELARDRGVVQRFGIEARVAATLTSDHVGKVLDIGELSDGRPYVVMELLEGADLARHLSERGPLPVAEVATYLLHAACGLAEAHARGIIHRDLKPANLFRTVRPDGSPLVKVLDFGIAKVRNEATERGLTATGVAIGSLPYMSPEQLRSTKHVDERTDIWALGVTLQELVTGSLPFPVHDVGMSEVAIRIWTAAPAPLPPTLRRAVGPVIERCLAKSPGDRYATVGELARALAPLGGADGAALAARVERVLTARRAPASPAAALDSTADAGEAPTGIVHSLVAHTNVDSGHRVVITSNHATTRTFRGQVSPPPLMPGARPRPWKVPVALAVLGAAMIATAVLVNVGSGGAPEVSPAVPVEAPSRSKPLENRFVRIDSPAEGQQVWLGGTDGDAFHERVLAAPTVAYELQEHEVTWRELAASATATPLVSPRDDDARPATGVGWAAARAYCRELSGDLPTEAQWEWAARGTWSPDLSTDGLLVYRGEGAAPRPPVGGTAATGSPVLADMLDNAREWTLGPWRAPDGSQENPAHAAVRGLPLMRERPSSAALPDPVSYREPACVNACDPPADLRDVGFRCARPGR